MPLGRAYSHKYFKRLTRIPNMSQPIVINIGAIPNDGTGDPLRTAFNDTNLNFANVFASGPVGSNIQIANNSILTLNTNGNLVLNPNGIGVVQANAHVVPDSTRIRNLGSSTLLWNTTYTQYLNTTYANIGTATIGNIGTLTIAVGNLHLLGGSNGYVLQTDGTGNLTWTAQTGGSGNATPAGANTQIQYNNAGNLGATAGFTFNNVSNTLQVPGVSTPAVFSFNGTVLENADLTHGATAAVVIPANGDAVVPVQLNNTYGNIAIQAGLDSDLTATWSFNNDGSLQLPYANVTGLGNITGPGNISYPFGPGAVLLADVDSNTSSYFSLTGVANATGILGYMGPAAFSNNAATGLVYTTDGNGNENDWYFQADGTTAFPNYTFPNVDGRAGQVFATYGNGEIYWANATSNTFSAITMIDTPSGPSNQIKYGLGNLVSWLDGGWVIGEYNGTDYGTEGIRISPGIEGAAEVNIPSNGTANVNPLSINNYSGNVTITTGNTFSNKTWTFDNTGALTLPGAMGPGAAGFIQTANSYPTLLAYGSSGHGGPEMDWTTSDDPITDFGNSSIIRNTMYLNGSGLYIGINENGNVDVPAPNWKFTPTGSFNPPSQPSNQRTGYGLTLKIGDTNDQAIITGPAPVDGVYDTAPRLVIAGQDGLNSGEGGDIYLWAGQSGPNGGSGGDIKVDGGVGLNGSDGGTIKIRGGYSYTGNAGSATGGFIEIQAGGGEYGAPVDIQSGQGNGAANCGNITVTVPTVGTWTFGNDNSFHTPQGGWIGVAGVKGDGTMLTGGNGQLTSLTSYYSSGMYSSCLTANPDGTLNITTYGDGTGQLGQWQFNEGALSLATVNNESAQLVGTRRIVGGINLTSPFSATLAAGGNASVAYTASSSSIISVKVTFSVQSNGSGIQFEQFDVVAVADQQNSGEVVFVVSNRVKGNYAVPDTQVTAAINGDGAIEISLTLDAVQTSGGWSSFDAVEFGIMVD